MIIKEHFSQIKRQIRNIYYLNAFSAAEFCKSFATFIKDYYFSGGKSSNLLGITILPTMRCNVKCSMCNIMKFMEIDEFKKEMSISDFQKVADIFKNICKNVVFAGGEPFIRQDIIEIISAFKSKNFNVGIFTNGILLNRQMIDLLIDLNLNFIIFSIHGTQETHNKIVSNQSAFSKATENIKYFCEIKKNTKVMIQSTILKENIRELDKIVEIGIELNVDVIRFGHLNFLTQKEISETKRLNLEGNSFIFDEELNLSDFEYNIKLLKQKYKNKVLFNPELLVDEIKDWYSLNFKTKRKCYFIWKDLFIFPNGDVFPCENVQLKMGNILKEPFNKIWNFDNYINFRKTVKKKLLPACHRCCKL